MIPFRQRYRQATPRCGIFGGDIFTKPRKRERFEDWLREREEAKRNKPFTVIETQLDAIAKMEARLVSAIMEALPQTAPPADVDADEWQKALVGAASIFVGALVVGEKIERVARVIIDDGKTVPEKLDAVDKIAPIAPSLSAAKLGEIFGGVSATTIKTSPWWKENRAGKKSAGIEERKGRHKERSGSIQDEFDDDE